MDEVDGSTKCRNTGWRELLQAKASIHRSLQTMHPHSGVYCHIILLPSGSPFHSTTPSPAAGNEEQRAGQDVRDAEQVRDVWGTCKHMLLLSAEVRSSAGLCFTQCGWLLPHFFLRNAKGHSEDSREDLPAAAIGSRRKGPTAEGWRGVQWRRRWRSMRGSLHPLHTALYASPPGGSPSGCTA